MPSTESDIPVFLFIALFNVESMTKPESQNTGIETMLPVKFIAKAEFLFPTTCKTLLAIDFAAPVFSKKVPIIEPHAIIIPMLFKVFPKPSDTVLTTKLTSKPLNTPIPKEAISRVKKG